MKYAGKYIHTITSDDVNVLSIIHKPHKCNCIYCDKKQDIINPGIGPIMEIDIGKQIHFHDGVYCIESQDQYNKRTKN